VTRSDRHPGDRLAALADGRLLPGERSLVLEHLARCENCRADYDAQLVLKGLLRGLPAPGAPADLRARLAGLAHPQPLALPPPGKPGRRSLRPGGSARPRRSGRAMAARAGAGLVSVTVLALAGAYAVGGTPEGAPVTPAIDRYAREHAAVTGGLPLTEPVLWQLPPAPPGIIRIPVARDGVRQVAIRSGITP
jgi:anti-sigma factor RsiW